MRQLGKVFVHSYPQWLDSITDSMDVNLSKLQETVKHGKLSMLQPMGLQRVGQQLNNKQLNNNSQNQYCLLIVGSLMVVAAKQTPS